MIRIYIILFSLLFSQSCSSQPCSELPDKFKSYDEAAIKISKAAFKITETVNTSRSSWIRSAKYKSCDGLTGYLLIGTEEKEYIHKGVPIGIWKSFSKATSLGSFYNENIKNRYWLILTN